MKMKSITLASPLAMLLALTLALGLLLIAPAAQAKTVNLIDVYRDALQNDPEYQAARFRGLSDQKEISINRAGLLPTVNLTAETTKNRLQTIQTPSTIVASGIRQFSSKNYIFTLTQPLFNVARWLAFKQAKSTAKQAVAEMAAAQQSLMTRVSRAYFEVLLAQDELRLVRAEKEATAKQLDQAEQQYRVGLKAITDVYDAQANYDIIVAAEIQGMNILKNTKETLRAITGRLYSSFAPLKKKIPLIGPKPHNVESWAKMGDEYNLRLSAARYSTQAAFEDFRIAHTGHYPTVDFVASQDRIRTGNSTGLGDNESRNESYALQLNFPLFQGGGVKATTEQAELAYKASLADRDRTYRETMDAVRQNYNNINSGISKIKADEQAIKSNESSLEATEAEFTVGTRTIVDVLDAQRDLFRAQQVHARDQYDYINSILALKEAAGTLCEYDLVEINHWLNPHRVIKPPKQHATRHRFKFVKHQAKAAKPKAAAKKKQPSKTTATMKQSTTKKTTATFNTKVQTKTAVKQVMVKNTNIHGPTPSQSQAIPAIKTHQQAQNRFSQQL